MLTSSQIAQAVLTKLAEEDSWNTPQMMLAGGGLGLGAGLGNAGAHNLGNIKNLVALNNQRPQLQQSRAALDQLLQQVRDQQPATSKLSPRALTKALLENKDHLPPEAYYTARRVYEEGLAGLSKNQKLTRLLQKRLRKSIPLRGMLGMGAGLGAGLLAAVGSGKFDS